MKSDQQFWECLFPAPGVNSTHPLVSMRSLPKNGRPLLLLPKEKSAAAGTFSLYPAQTPKARLVRNGLQRLAKLGLPIGRPVELRISKADGFAGFLSNLAQVPGNEVPKFGVLAGNPASPSQRFMILVFNPQLQPMTVVKAGLNPEARGLVVRESEFLKKAPSTFRNLPSLIGTFHDERLDALALDFYAGDSPEPEERDRVARLLSSWIGEKETARLQELTEWQALERMVPANFRTEAGCNGIRDSVIHPCLYHGDFAPWNIKVPPSGQWTVLDWERGQVRGMPAWDWFHFYLQCAILVQKLRGRDLLNHAEMILRTAEFQQYARASHIEGLERRLLAAYLLHTVHVIKPSEGREEAEELWRMLQ